VSILGVPLYAYHSQVAVAVLVHEVPAVAAAPVRVVRALVPAQRTQHMISGLDRRNNCNVQILGWVVVVLLLLL
jgi:hypothetical protein